MPLVKVSILNINKTHFMGKTSVENCMLSKGKWTDLTVRADYVVDSLDVIIHNSFIDITRAVVDAKRK